MEREVLRQDIRRMIVVVVEEVSWGECEVELAEDPKQRHERESLDSNVSNLNINVRQGFVIRFLRWDFVAGGIFWSMLVCGVVGVGFGMVGEAAAVSNSLSCNKIE